MKRRAVFSTVDAGIFCNSSTLSIIRWIKMGKIKAHKTPGGYHRIVKKDLYDFMKKYGMPIPEEVRKGAGAPRDSGDIEENIKSITDSFQRFITSILSFYHSVQ